ncbi:MAG: flap endonuclease [Armatimonadetes bacterium]|nr:flap endonuclease [Armatimonadota bacterium]
MKVHLVDVTYELFRAYFGAPKLASPDGREVGAVRGLLASMLYLLQQEGATHVACASDTVIRSFRNDLYAGYKTEAGVPLELLAQFPLAEEGLRALGLVVWGMIELEADDALAAGAARYAAEVDQVIIATPDKDLAQCVDGTRVVLYDRRGKRIIDEAAVRAKWGVAPRSIPDWLALVGDTSDGYPGIPGWGKKTASAVLAVYEHVEAIPDDARAWKLPVRGADRLAATLASRRVEAALYKRLATLRTDVPPAEPLAELEWHGARPELRDFCGRQGYNDLVERAGRWA